MDKQKLLQADYLDVIYDGRNKVYGSYHLRRTYGRRLMHAAATMLLLAGVLAGASAFRRPSSVLVGHKANERVVELTKVWLKEREIVLPKPVVEKASAKPAGVKTKLFTPPVVTADVKPDETVMTNNSDLKNTLPGPGSDGDSTGLASETGEGRERGTLPMEPVKGAEGPKVFVEQMPTFPGDLNAYLASHLKYPPAAREAGVEGRVIVEFVIDEDGGISSARVARGIGGGCDEEALRVISSMPHWKPGRQNGSAVKVLFNVAVRFVLQ